MRCSEHSGLLQETGHVDKPWLDDTTRFVGCGLNRALNTTAEQPPYTSAPALLFYLDFR